MKGDLSTGSPQYRCEGARISAVAPARENLDDNCIRFEAGASTPCYPISMPTWQIYQMGPVRLDPNMPERSVCHGGSVVTKKRARMGHGS